MVNLTAFGQCSDLYFSEYIEGSGNNKAIEIYNPTNAAINLTDYAIVRLNGGSSNPDTFYMNGMLAAYDVYIIANSGADATILAAADTTGSATYYNGDDALAIVNIKTKTSTDIFGTPGMDPGTEWAVGSGSSKEHTLVRKSTIKGGQSNWTTGVTEWDVYPQNTFTYLGSHTSDCYVPTMPQVAFGSTSETVMENDGNIMVNVSINNPSGTDATMVDVVITGGTAVSGTDYTATSPTTLTFAAGSTSDESITIMITDNSMTDVDKTIELKLRNVSTGAEIGADSSMTITIENDDYLVADIKDVRGNDANWEPALDGQKVEIKGIVYGIDLDGNAGLSFTIIDSTAGMNIFNFRDVNDYVVTEGDEITVRGEITSYNGLIEVFADSIKVNSTGNTLKDPVVVSKPSEDTESDFIEIRKVWIADTTTVWPNNGNVALTNGTDTFQIRIDRDLTDIVGQPVISDTMDIIGIGGQFDNSAFPLDAGYQIFPRRLSDIMTWDKSSVRDFTLIANVYPNPTNGFVQISAIQPIVSLTVTDALGNVVFTQNVSNELQTSLELPSVSSGVYFVQINAENASSMKRLVVE